MDHKIPPYLPLPKGGDINVPLWKRGIEGDFMVIPLIFLAFEIHFSKG
jgi:hypothetical protein